MDTKVVNLNKEDFDVYIGRPSKWGNPFRIGVHGTREKVISLYKEWIRTKPHLMAALESLRGKTLGCYCKPLPCHGDALLELLEEKDES